MEESVFNITIGVYKALGIVATIVAGTWYLSSRLTKVETKVENFDKRLTNIEGRMDSAFGSASPVSLRPAGIKAIENSGLKDWINKNKDQLMKECELKNKFKNQYDIQECAFRFFDDIDFGDFETQVKKSAFSYGWSEQVMRRIGGIYFRDILLEKYDFKPEDLDK